MGNNQKTLILKPETWNLKFIVLSFWFYVLNFKFHVSGFMLGVCFALFFCVSLALPAEAARLYFEPQEETAGAAGEFAVALNLDAVEQINALSAAVIVPKNLEPLDTSDGNSIINLWLDRPNWDEVSRLLTFSGIIPGGFGGQGGRLLVIIFKVNQPGAARLGFDRGKTEVYLNGPDGELDQAVLLEEKEINITAGKENLPLNLPDNGAPEPFAIQLNRDFNIFDNQWFIAFTSQDKGVGLSHYEICETKKVFKRNGENSPKSERCWQKGVSPYRLADQALNSYIFVKALDKKGNFRITGLPPPKVLFRYKNYQFYAIILLSLIIFALLWEILRRRKNKARRLARRLP